MVFSLKKILYLLPDGGDRRRKKDAIFHIFTKYLTKKQKIEKNCQILF